MREAADALVLFGATGDLCHRKIFPSLYHLVRRGRLDEADQVLAGAGKSSPDNPRLMYATAEIYVKAHHNLDVARELLKRYLSANISPDDPPKSEAAKLLRQVQGG